MISDRVVVVMIHMAYTLDFRITGIRVAHVKQVCFILASLVSKSKERHKKKYHAVSSLFS